MLSLRTNIDANRAAAAGCLEIELRLGENLFVARIDDNGFRVDPGAAPSPDATLAGSPSTLAGLMYGGRPLDEAINARELVLLAPLTPPDGS